MGNLESGQLQQAISREAVELSKDSSSSTEIMSSNISSFAFSSVEGIASYCKQLKQQLQKRKLYLSIESTWLEANEPECNMCRSEEVQAKPILLISNIEHFLVQIVDYQVPGS